MYISFFCSCNFAMIQPDRTDWSTNSPDLRRVMTTLYKFFMFVVSGISTVVDLSGTKKVGGIFSCFICIKISTNKNIFVN